uniref:4Fe-4S dicluster domain-containing protein n=1 Tax=Castellaniella defragrans TaxID=75697 RepID=UPI003342671A
MALTRRQLLTGCWSSSTPVGPSTANGQPWRPHASSTCLARRGIECRVCGESCDIGAIRFRPQPGRPAYPHIDIELCSLCGDCLPACPVAALVPEAA